MAHGPDLLLINLGGTRRRVYQDLEKDFSAVEPPFWAALTAGYVRSRGFAVEILDANVRNMDERGTVEDVISRGAELNAVVVYGQQANTCTPLMTGVTSLCRALKAAAPEMRLVVTGWHPSALPERSLRETGADMIAEGEGFETLLGLLEGKARSKVPGLWWRQGKSVRNNPRPPPVADLTTELGEVAWDLLPMSSGDYRAFNWMCLQDLGSRNHYAGMFTSLGCPYKCSFCAIHATFGGRRMRYWTPEWALVQFDTLARVHGVKNINLIDELFVFNPRHYMPIARGLLEREYRLNFCAFARVDRVDAMSMEELKTLKRAGFNWFKLGIESSSTAVLRRASKGAYTREVSKRVVGKIHDAGIDICANFMFGLPGDTWETMQDTLNLAFELNCAFPSFFCAMAVPGSDLYADALKNGPDLPAEWTGFAQQGYDFLPLATESLTATDVLAFRDYAFDAYFKNPRYLSMIETKFGPPARRHVVAMTAVRLKRKILGD